MARDCTRYITMPRQSRHPKRSNHADAMRRDIACLAARLMAEDGLDDYRLAKRKAAKQLGAPDSEALPTNTEIEEALRAYQSFYQEDELRQRLALLRRSALKSMQLFEDFSPYLTGPVLEGTAGPYAEVELDFFVDSAKDVEIFLLNREIDFEHVNNLRADPESPEARLRLYTEETTVLLSIYPRVLERTRRRSPHNAQATSRARTQAVAALLAQT